MDNNRPYVFISYAHSNSNVVFPYIEAMKKGGINLWYDEGIEAGSEWPEFIAQKVVGCSKFVLFVSNASLQSQNCKRELNFAISRKKDILSVFIEDATLSPGMEMQLGTYQALYRKRFESDDQFSVSLAQEHYFDACRFGKNEEQAKGKTPPQEPQRSQPTWTPYAQPYSYVQHNTNGQSNPTVQTNYNSQSTSTDLNSIFDSIFGNNTQKKVSAKGAVDPTKKAKRSRIVAVLLAFFLGCFGAQKFYLGQVKRGIVYAIFSFTYVPYFLSLIEMFILIFSSKEKLKARYGYIFTK